MRIKVSDYIAKKLVEHGITQVFSVTGGGAMHLNDGLGHQEGLNCIYNHHEQASAIAAESYARIHNRMAALCVTTGPGGTNAITGVVGGWLDSIPMLVLSGQVRYDTTARWSGVGIPVIVDFKPFGLYGFAVAAEVVPVDFRCIEGIPVIFVFHGNPVVGNPLAVFINIVLVINHCIYSDFAFFI